MIQIKYTNRSRIVQTKKIKRRFKRSIGTKIRIAAASLAMGKIILAEMRRETKVLLRVLIGIADEAAKVGGRVRVCVPPTAVAIQRERLMTGNKRRAAGLRR